jgi:hypothetical protein
MYGDFTFVNNVLFNWVHRTVDGGDHRSFFNIYNNYLKPGPATPIDQPIAWRLLKPESERSKTVVDNFGRAYVTGNVIEGNERVTRDNWDGGVQPDSRAPVTTVLPKIRVDQPFAHAPLTVLTAGQAYTHVLDHAGATRPVRDDVDRRIIETVRTGLSLGRSRRRPHRGHQGRRLQRTHPAGDPQSHPQGHHHPPHPGGRLSGVSWNPLRGHRPRRPA